MQFKKAKGERIGAIPFGYSLDVDGVSLTENADEQEVISVAKELKASGLSLRAIATELSERGYTARNGRNFQATQIQRILNARETDRVLRGGRG
jgi:site-specific DNA recombinase